MKEVLDLADYLGWEWMCLSPAGRSIFTPTDLLAWGLPVSACVGDCIVAGTGAVFQKP